MNYINLDRPFLVADKIYLRPIDIDDVNELYLNWINDGAVIDNLATVFPTSKEDLENFVKSILKNPNFVFFAIVVKDSNKHIGNVKLGPIDWISRTTNYGLMLGDKSSWGKGYAQEAFSLILKFAFDKLNLHKVWDMAVVTNIASIKANEKVGFKIEAELEKHVYKNGKYHNVAVLALLAENYYKNKENDSQ
ncbi:MAG: GNAT family N-acetyltransferase [Chitinophagaceae bacterium]|nr:GNAT family N-acetyltransferase [Chitinophagaceae bacterium]